MKKLQIRLERRFLRNTFSISLSPPLIRCLIILAMRMLKWIIKQQLTTLITVKNKNKLKHFVWRLESVFLTDLWTFRSIWWLGNIFSNKIWIIGTVPATESDPTSKVFNSMNQMITEVRSTIPYIIV